MAFPSAVQIREVGVREGVQTSARRISTVDKIALINALSATGVKEIETASFVRPERVPQWADAGDVVAGFTPVAGVRYTALYLNQTGFKRAAQNPQLNLQGWLTAAASATFLKKNANTDLDTIVAEIPGWLELFRQHGKDLHGVMISTAFGCNDEGAITPAQVLNVLDRILRATSAAGAAPREISLADTMGWASPEKLRKLVDLVAERCAPARVSLHLHDTRGTGIANVYAGLQQGVGIFDASVGGVGGCPFARGAAGNVATEDLLYLCAELGISTGIDLARYVECARMAEKFFGEPLPGRYYRSK